MTAATSHVLRAQVPGHPYNCRCAQCRPLKAAWERDRQRRIAYGTWQPFVDAEPARQNLCKLMSAGAPLHRIAAVTGYDRGYLGRIIWGCNRRPFQRIRPEIAADLVAVTLDQVGIAAHTPVDPTGTLRRLRALIAAGRPGARIARDIGRGVATVRKITNEQSTVTAGFAALVAEHYPLLKDRIPEDDGVSRRDAEASRLRAAALGWEPPSAWDDDIDDPRAIANTITERQYQNLAEEHAFRAAQMEDARLLTIRGCTAEAISAHLGVTDRTITRWRVANGWKKADP